MEYKLTNKTFQMKPAKTISGEKHTSSTPNRSGLRYMGILLVLAGILLLSWGHYRKQEKRRDAFKERFQAVLQEYMDLDVEIRNIPHVEKARFRDQVAQKHDFESWGIMVKAAYALMGTVTIEDIIDNSLDDK